jgi:hypothetical protein
MKENFFSPIAKEYARYRPTYPKELFTYLTSISPAHSLAWAMVREVRWPLNLRVGRV